MYQQVIDGKRYDTETARLVYNWDSGHSSDDFNQRSKGLYRTTNGNWFILHAGGPATDMAKWYGDSCSGGQSIEPVTEEGAFAFLQEHSGDSEANAAIEEFFSNSVSEA